VIVVINAIQIGEFHSSHKINRTGMCDETGTLSAMLPVCLDGTGKKPEEVSWSISRELRAGVLRAGHDKNFGAPV
jgi:hypothetical protein